jgi:peptidyl-prolyl cis-trans isomerase SurA
VASRIEWVDTADMTKTTSRLLPYRPQSLAAGCAVALTVLACSGLPLRAQSVACMVNGDPITNYDIEQRTKLNFLTTHKQMSREEVSNELIDEKVKIKEAKRFGVDPSSSDIEQSYAQMSSRMRITTDQLTKSLESQGIRPDTLKARLKTEMVWTSLVRGRYKESLQVGEKEVNEAAQESGDKADVEAFEYKLQPYVLIVPRGSAPTVIESRRKEAEAVRERVQSCDEASTYFRTMQNAAVKEPVTKTSADIPGPLREVLDKTPIGHMTAPEVTKQGVELFALCGRKPTTIDSPKKKEIRDKMYVQKYETKSKAYLADIRKAAMIECK